MATASSNAGAGRANAFDAIAASETDSVLVAAKAGKRIRVLAFLINQGDTTPSAVTFNSKGSGAGAACYAPLKAGANGLVVVPELAGGWFATNAGEGLTVTTGAGSTSSVAVVFEVVT